MLRGEGTGEGEGGGDSEGREGGWREFREVDAQCLCAHVQYQMYLLDAWI